MDFVEFKKGEQKEFLLGIKNKYKLSWLKLIKITNKNRSTLFGYLREDWGMPKQLFNELNYKYPTKYYNTKVIPLTNTPHKINLPKLSMQLSEFIGALAGDGHLHNNPAELSITVHRILDYQYIKHLENLFDKLFYIKPTLFSRDNMVKLRFYSKELVQQLNINYNLPIGKKKGHLHIPFKILKNNNYLICYIRGLFDTDGSINRHHKESGAIIEISSRDPQFLAEISKSLIKLKFKVSVGYKSVKIYDKEQIDTFFKVIKPSNFKHKLKYETFKKTGRVPLNKDIKNALVI